MNTKKISKSDASPEMQAALAKMTLHNLLDTYPGELIRFFVLSTHYRRPIEYSEDEIESKRKGLETFYRLFERIERICSKSSYATAPELTEPRASARADVHSATLAAACEDVLVRFTQAMDDDFNTAGAIASLFDFATAVNRFVEEEKLETTGADSAKKDALAATGWLIAVARLIGLFLDPPQEKTAGDGVGEKAMTVLIKVRQHLRKKKDFESADLIRNLLADSGITLEDLPSGTVWRAD